MLSYMCLQMYLYKIQPDISSCLEKRYRYLQVNNHQSCGLESVRLDSSRTQVALLLTCDLLATCHVMIRDLTWTWAIDLRLDLDLKIKGTHFFIGLKLS